jgi:TRAP-type mannitol/chloroaromatic compound transport system permease large subunit
MWFIREVSVTLHLTNYRLLMMRALLAVLAGLISGSVVNMSLIRLNTSIFPLPAGTDTSTMEGLMAAMPALGMEYFLFTLLAHASGTLVGSFLAAQIAPARAGISAASVGVFFLAGGIYMALQLPAPKWFEAADLILAYIPMAWLGVRIAQSRRLKQASE